MCFHVLTMTYFTRLFILCSLASWLLALQLLIRKQNVALLFSFERYKIFVYYVVYIGIYMDKIVIMMFEFGEYCFIKWKFKFWNFLSENLKYNIFDQSKLLARSIEMVKKKSWNLWISRSLLDFCSSDRKEHLIDQK